MNWDGVIHSRNDTENQTRQKIDRGDRTISLTVRMTNQNFKLGRVRMIAKHYQNSQSLTLLGMGNTMMMLGVEKTHRYIQTTSQPNVGVSANTSNCLKITRKQR